MALTSTGKTVDSIEPSIGVRLVSRRSPRISLRSLEIVPLLPGFLRSYEDTGQLEGVYGNLPVIGGEYDLL